MHICIHTRTYLRACSHISMDVCARVLTVCDSDYAKTNTVRNSNCARDSCAQCTVPAVSTLFPLDRGATAYHRFGASAQG